MVAGEAFVPVGGHGPDGVLECHGRAQVRRRVEGLYVPARVDDGDERMPFREVGLVSGDGVSLSQSPMDEEVDMSLDVMFLSANSQFFDHLSWG